MRNEERPSKEEPRRRVPVQRARKVRAVAVENDLTAVEEQDDLQDLDEHLLGELEPVLDAPEEPEGTNLGDDVLEELAEECCVWGASPRGEKIRTGPRFRVLQKIG
jgi:hypothetical protein